MRKLLYSSDVTNFFSSFVIVYFQLQVDVTRESF